MATLVMTDPSGREQEYEIKAKPQVFGRGEDSDVVLGSRSVARHHMRMWADRQGRIMVEDLTGGRAVRLDGELTSGTFELGPGSILEAGVFSFSLPGKVETDHEGEVLEKAAPKPVLEGTKGPTKGLAIELSEGDNDVGRDPGLYLVIDDHSVSRLHARLACRGGRVKLTDMRSSNGTFVNGKRVEGAELQTGDKVRFGNLEFRLVYGETQSKSVKANKRRRLILVTAGSLVAAFLIIGFGIKKCGRKPASQHPVTPVTDRIPIEVRVEQRLKAARAAMEKYDWKAAEKAVEEALDLHPISTEARALKKSILDERAHKSIYDDGMVNYDLNKGEDALRAFRKIPENSAYFKKVKYKITEIEGKLIDHHTKEGRAYFRAQQYKKAHRHFLAYMELRPCDRKTYKKWVKKSETRMKQFKIRFAPSAYRCDKEDQASTEPAIVEVDPEEVLRATYPNRKIYAAINMYYKGKIETALGSIKKLKVLSKDEAVRKTAEDLDTQLSIIAGKYKSGMSRLLRDQLKEAREDFRIAIEADKKIMPEGVISRYREDIQSQLAGKFYKLGLEEYNRKHWVESFTHYMECVAVDPDDTDCLRGLNDLEARGEEAHRAVNMFLQRGQDRQAYDLLQLLKQFTRPESLSHKKAVLKLKKFK